MISKTQFGVLFVLLAIVFGYYIFLRSDLIGYDSQYYFSVICGQHMFESEPIASNMLFSVLPCNILLAKLLLFVCALVSGIFLIAGANLLTQKKHWAYATLPFLTTLYIMEFLKFENDQIAYPFLFAATYFLMKGFLAKDQKPEYHWLAAMLFVAGTLFWHGSIIQLLSWAFTPIFLFAIVALGIVIVFPKEILTTILGHGVKESIPFTGLRFIGIPIVGLYGLRHYPAFFKTAIVIFLIGVINPKFAILSLPFLIAGLAKLLEKKEMILKALSLVGIGLVGVSYLFISIQPPFEYEWNAAKYAVMQGKSVNNDWEYGHMINLLGGKSNSFAGPFNQQEWQVGSVVLSKEKLIFLPDSNKVCMVLKTFVEVSVFEC